MGRSIGKTLGLHTNTHTDVCGVLTWPQVFASPCPLTNTPFHYMGVHQSVLTDRWFSMPSFVWILSVNIKAAKWPSLCLWVCVCVCFQGDKWQGGGSGPNKRLTKPSWLHYWAHWLCTDELKSQFQEAHTHFLFTHGQRGTHRHNHTHW